MTIPLARFLVDFSTLPPPPSAAVLDAPARPLVDAAMARIEAARQEALAEARASSERQLEAARAEADRRLADERRRWAADEGERIGTALADGLQALEDRIADTLAALLEPLVLEAARRKAAAEFRDVLSGLLANAEGLAVTVSGPDDLTAAIRAAHPGAANLAVRTAEAADATARAGDTHITTQLEAWTGRLRESLRASA